MTEELVGPGVTRVEKITTTMATDGKEAMENVKVNIKRPLKYVYDMPGFLVKKRHDQKLALVGGGPSLAKSIEELDGSFEVIVACGSSHDYLRNKARIPHWAVLCDPDPLSLQYLKRPHPAVQYMIATHCAPRLFDYLKPYPQVAMWHCFSENHDEYNEIQPGFKAIGGGCTVGLRSLSIALLFGYSNIHFFGFDSCVGESDKPYAYDLVEDDKTVGQLHKIRIGADTPGEKVYICQGYHLAQAANFKDLYRLHNDKFTPTFHGGGMMSDLYDLIKAEEAKVIIEQQAVKVANG